MRRTFVAFALLAYTSAFCGAADPVFGPPKMLVDAQIIQDVRGQSARFVASDLSWDESRQNWDRTLELQGSAVPQDFRGRSVTRKKSRAIIVLQSQQFVASLNTLSFSNLYGDRIEPEGVPKLLEANRAVAFIPKGCAIHPSIAAAMHPETLVVSRRSYPEDPVVIALPSGK